MRTFALVVILLQTPDALAAAGISPRFSFDGENQRIVATDVPPGPFDWAAKPTSNPVRIDGGAAHGGSYGLEVVDTDVSTGTGNENELSHHVDAGSPNYYVRMWFRIAAITNDTGRAAFAQLSTINPSLLDAYLAFPGNNLRLGATNQGAPGNYSQAPSSFNLVTGNWELIELGVEGAGTASGRASIYAAGVLQSEITGANWTGLSLSDVLVGEPYSSDKTWGGTLQFDDIRADMIPMPTFIEVTGPSTAPTLACVRLTANAISSFNDAGAPAPAPQGIALVVGGAGAGKAQFFADPQCSAALGALTIAPGATSVDFFVVDVVEEPTNISAYNTDYLSRPFITVTFVDGGLTDGGTADGGIDSGAADSGADSGSPADSGVSTVVDSGSDGGAVDATTADLGVGCNCGSAPSGLLSAVAFGVLLALRRSRANAAHR